MIEVLKAMATSGAILFPIVILVIVVSIAAVKRGEASMGGGHHGLSTDGHAAVLHGVGSVAGAAPAAARKPGAEPVEGISVMQVLLFGIVMFTAVMVLLLLVSVFQHS